MFTVPVSPEKNFKLNELLVLNNSDPLLLSHHNNSYCSWISADNISKEPDTA